MFKRSGYSPLRGLVFVCIAVAPAVAQYDPPAGYYNSAVGLTGAPLKSALNAIIDGHTTITYANREARLEILDQDPANSANVIEVYSGYSVPKTDFLPGVTPANTEHLWPNAYGIDDVNPAYGDLFNLRPCDTEVNSERANKYYDDGGTLPAHPEAPLCRDDADSWEARPVEKGDLARSMFYMDTRYEGDLATDGFANNLTLTDNVALITGTATNMGKLSTLINWHFSDAVDESERQRNHIIYQTTYLGVTFQQNRNPFIDHPEYVWAIWGPTPNDSRLYLGATEPGDGASLVAVDLGEVIVNGTVPGPQNVTLNKVGTNPTTYDIALSGDGSSTAAGTRQSFLGGVQNRVIAVGLTTSTATAGVKSGELTVNNTDLTSSGAGRGDADGDDVADVSLRVLDHANGSFDDAVDQNTLTLDFGTVDAGTGLHNLGFTIYSLESTPGFTAALDLDAIGGTGDTAALTTDAAPLSNLPAGTGQAFTAWLDSASVGSFSATYTISGSDQDLSGAQPTSDLVLTLVGEVVSACAAADTNCADGVTLDDVEPFVNVLLELASPCSSCAVDTNNDNFRNAADVQLFVDALLGI
ncbi:MAG TPA: endonuclease [Phycisphaerae bacterium]|nr:endonuclease [Phycisphaerae bacterium]